MQDKLNLNALTGLRFIAALYVFIYHIDISFPLTFLPGIIQEIVHQGALGVNIFFILSGFILTYSYQKKDIGSLKFYKEFITKRLAKIYAVYILGLIFFLSALMVLHEDVQPFITWTTLNVFMLQSYVPPLSMTGYGDGTWSISTEFFFYLLFPLLLNLFLKASKNQLVKFATLFVICSFLPGIVDNMQHPRHFSIVNYTFPLLRISEFILGIIAGMLSFKYNVTIKPITAVVALFVLFVCISLFGYRLGGHVAHNLVMAPVTVVLLMYVCRSHHGVSKFLANKTMVYLGKVSYSFYICQITVMNILKICINRGYDLMFNDYVICIMLLFINLVIAMIFYHVAEVPVHRFIIDRIKRNKGSQALIPEVTATQRNN